jgi:hypothetical protein
VIRPVALGLVVLGLVALSALPAGCVALVPIFTTKAGLAVVGAGLGFGAASLDFGTEIVKVEDEKAPGK